VGGAPHVRSWPRDVMLDRALSIVIPMGYDSVNPLCHIVVGMITTD